MKYFHLYKKCNLCPRACNVDRTDSSGSYCIGFCGERSVPRVAYVGPHFGEEPPLTGKNGSGTIFFSGCSLRCSFCQNYQISHGGLGKTIDFKDLLENITDMIQSLKVHNINFVTPDHFFPHVFHLAALIKEINAGLPLVYNLSGYQSQHMLQISEEFSDIYIPDFKYSDSRLAQNLSGCPDYPKVSLQALDVMIKQKGFLDICPGDEGIAQKGVLVRHLILPGHIENSINAMTMLFIEFGSGLPISLMSQYYPVQSGKNKSISRTLLFEEFSRVFDHCVDLGFQNLFLQHPRDSGNNENCPSPFLPDFTLSSPFHQH